MCQEQRFGTVVTPALVACSGESTMSCVNANKDIAAKSSSRRRETQCLSVTNPLAERRRRPSSALLQGQPVTKFIGRPADPVLCKPEVLRVDEERLKVPYRVLSSLSVRSGRTSSCGSWNGRRRRDVRGCPEHRGSERAGARCRALRQMVLGPRPGGSGAAPRGLRVLSDRGAPDLAHRCGHRIDAEPCGHGTKPSIVRTAPRVLNPSKPGLRDCQVLVAYDPNEIQE